MGGINRRGALRLAGAAGVAGLTAACQVTRDDAPSDPLYDSHVRIGMLVPEAGGYRSIGDDIVNGFRRFLAVNDNRLGGHPFVIVQEDEGESPDDAREGLQRLLDQDVEAVVGVATSAALEGVSAAVEDANIPLLGANASPEAVQGNPYIWRTSYHNRDPGEALGGYLVGAVNGQVAIIAEDDPAGRDAVEGLREAFAVADATDQLEEPIFTSANSDPGGRFFEAALAQLQALEPAAVFSVYAGAAAVEFVRQYLAAGFEPGQLYGPAYLTEGPILDDLGDAALGIWTSANYAADLVGASNRSFTVSYRDEFARPPTIYAVAGYDAGVALDKAIRLTEGNPNRRDINTTLGEVGHIDSPRGRWQFNQNRTPTQKWYLRRVDVDGPLLANLVIQELGTLG